jgi:hypothetical protein
VQPVQKSERAGIITHIDSARRCPPKVPIREIENDKRGSVRWSNAPVRVQTADMANKKHKSSQPSYDHAIREFIDWYCSEPRLAFNKTVVTRSRINLEQAQYASSTINLRLAAIRRLADEPADCGLLSPDLAAGIRRIKGVNEAWHARRELVNRRSSEAALGGVRR